MAADYLKRNEFEIIIVNKRNNRRMMMNKEK